MILSTRRIVVLMVVLLVSAAAAVAQQTASISGLISDQTGGAVVGARVDLISGSAAPRSAASDSSGRYRFDALDAGDYTVRVTAPALQAMERRVRVTAAGTVVADFRLAVQALQESVDVTAEQVRAEVEGPARADARRGHYRAG